MTNQPPLPKRSAIGKPRAPAPPPVDDFDFGPPPAPPNETPLIEDIGKFTADLKKQTGVEVSLIETAGWGRVKRAAVTAWLLAGQPMDRVPEGIAQLLAAPQMKVASCRVCGVAYAIGGCGSEVCALSGQQAPPLLPVVPPAPPPPAMTARPVFPPIAEIPATRYADDAKPVVDHKAPPPPRSRPASAPEVVSESPDYNKLVATILRESDLDSEYEELEAQLEVGDSRRDYATVYEALDKAERRALRAHSLWVNAKLEHTRLTLDQEQVDAELWREAKKALEAAPSTEPEPEETPEPAADGKKPKKAPKARSKMITNGDVEAQIATMFPDEWRGGKMRVEKSKLTVTQCERFSELWSQKVRSLNTMLSSVSNRR